MSRRGDEDPRPASVRPTHPDGTPPTRTPPGADAGPLLARLRRPASETPTRLAVVSDPHLTPTASGTWKVYHRTETRLRATVDARPDVAADVPGGVRWR